MENHESKLESSNVVVGFESQDDAESALLGLRIAGFSDSRIGYYYQAGRGVMSDLLVRDHRFSAAILGGVIGGVLGWFLTRLDVWAGQNLDPFGLMITGTVFGALFLGMAGGMIGMWTQWNRAKAPDPAGATEPFVLSVDAGTAQGRALRILHEHGGHDISRHAVPVM
jgi:hypothetical protein